MNMLEFSDVTIRLGEKTILEKINLTAKRGEIVTIVGPNGSGKSTLLKSIIGSIPTAKGAITIAQETRIGYVPQRLDLDQSLPMTVKRFLNLPHKTDRKILQEILTKALLDHLQNQQISSLSGGQLQRVLLARALLGKPNLLLLDEPTQGLDQPATADFYKNLKSISTELNATVLIVSHDLHVVMSASDQVICLNGHVCCSGPPSVVSSAPEYRALFGHGTAGTFALYQHDHDHDHDHNHEAH